MTLSEEQRAEVTKWVAAGDSLSTVQKKLIDQFKVTLTYRDVRFLVDDLNLALKDAAPKVDATDLAKGSATPPPAPAAPKPPEKKGLLDKAKEKLGLGKEPAPGSPPDEDADLFDDEFPPGGGTITVTVDKVTLIPGAIASGAVTFSDGVTGKWIVDEQGRPGFTEVSQPGYRPSPPDAQAFMQELGMQLQKRGF